MLPGQPAGSGSKYRCEGGPKNRGRKGHRRDGPRLPTRRQVVRQSRRRARRQPSVTRPDASRNGSLPWLRYAGAAQVALHPGTSTVAANIVVPAAVAALTQAERTQNGARGLRHNRPPETNSASRPARQTTGDSQTSPVPANSQTKQPAGTTFGRRASLTPHHRHAPNDRCRSDNAYQPH